MTPRQTRRLVLGQIARSRAYRLVLLNGSIALALFYELFVARGEGIANIVSLFQTEPPDIVIAYITLRLVSFALFGLNMALLVYAWQHTNVRLIREQASSVIALLAGAFAIACTRCVQALFGVFGLYHVTISTLQSLEFAFISAAMFLGTIIFSLISLEEVEPLPTNISSTKRAYVFQILLLFTLVLLSLFFIKLGIQAHAQNQKFSTSYEVISAEVLPTSGYATKLVFGNIGPELVADGVIDLDKVEALYSARGGVPPAMMQILTTSSTEPVVVTQGNAGQLVTILWAIGLSNRMEVNLQSPVVGKHLNNFASTGGWQLGKAESGGEYFNKYPLIPLTLVQQKRVQQIAQSTYRPCCDNSTFFQDCNHGSAAMAIIELGVSEGLTDSEIYETLLAFNSYWFPQNYIETALYFKIEKGTDWKDADPRLVLSKEYSSVSGWLTNVDSVVSKVPGLLPQAAGGGSCGA
jgi:hypothetical protein